MNISKIRFEKGTTEHLPIILKYDKEIIEGLFIVVENKYVKTNSNKLNIKRKAPEKLGSWGVEYSRQFDFVIITIKIRAEESKSVCYQLIITNKLTFKSIDQNKNGIFDEHKDFISKGVALLNCKTNDEANELLNN